MKKLIPTVAVLLLTFNLSAQYKKAGFFEKEGRTYELSAQLYNMGHGNGSPIGYKLGFGRDKDGKRFFSSWDIQYIPSHAYSYTTVDGADKPITVSGKSKSIFVYGANYNFHILNNDAENKPKVQPFVGIGFNILLAGGVKEETMTPEPYDYARKGTSMQSISVGFNGGAGCIINLSSKWSLKAQGGYSHQFNMSSDDSGEDEKPFFVFDSYIYASAGIRLRIATE